MTHRYRAEVPHLTVYPTLGITVGPGDEVELDIEPDPDNPIAGLVPVDELDKPKARSKKQDVDGTAKSAESQE